jgi:hypothetical protein
MADGRLNKCIECTKRDVMAHRLNNLEKVRAYDKMRSSMPHRKLLAKQIHERWKSNYPNRRAAQVALGNAVRSGAIKKQPCFVCGQKAQAHHPDYDRPLDVVWLCAVHHAKVHEMVT